MFLKKQTVRRNGKVYSYYRIVSTYRDERGRSKHRIEKYIGALSEEEAEAIRRELRAQGASGQEPPAPRSAESGTGPQAVAFMLRAVRRIMYPPRMPKEWNVADTDVILIVREGNGELRMGGARHALQPGTAFYCAPGSGIHLANARDERLIVERIAFDAIETREAANDEPAYVRREGGCFRAGRIEPSSFRRLLQLSGELQSAVSAAGGRTDTLAVQAAFYRLLSVLFLQPVETGDESEADWVQEAVRHIHEHFAEELTRERLAANAGVSPEHFSRVFKRATGSSFTDYVGDVRIRKARELLQLSGAGIGEIAKRTGFRSENYFSRKFRQATGVPPTAYRKGPRSCASLTAYATSCLMTLGIVPRWGVIEPWMSARFGRRMDLSAFSPISESDIRSFGLSRREKPDLILACASSGELERFRSIAPVCAVPDENERWREPLLRVAEAVGAAREAENWLESFEAAAEQARIRLRQSVGVGETVAILKIVSDKLYVYGRSTSMGGTLLYELLRLQPPAAVQRELIDRGLPNRRVLPHELADFAADHIFLFDYRSGWFPDKPDWMRDEGWDRLEAVRGGRVYAPNADIFYGYDCLSLELQLEETLRLLESRSLHSF